MRLSDASVTALPPAVARPGYRRDDRRCGIVHLGIGAFHRAHQAVYTDDALAAGDGDWRITGVSLRSPAVRDTLAPQDGLYTVTERANGAERVRLIGSIDRVLVAPENPEAAVAALADAATRVVTITVTEQGYYRHPATGRLVADDPAIASEIAGGTPTTLYGFLAAALRRRRAEGAAPLTLVSCDNLPSNGRLLAALLAEFLERHDPSLGAWAKGAVGCVDTMVDRIVPASTAVDRDRVASVLGQEDAGAIVTEPFRHWVIEDAFVGPRPRWEAGGAQFVADVRPFELAKLRLLNGSHSVLAYIGLQRGHRFVHQAIAEPLLRRFVLAQATNEAAPSLPATARLDPAAYLDAIVARLENADLDHRLDQIAVDGSQKLPQRWIAALIERRANGQPSPCHVVSLAAWIAWTRDATRAGDRYPIDDPLAERLAAIWREAEGEPGAVAREVVASLGMFPDAAASDGGLVDHLSTTLARWLEGDRDAMLAEAAAAPLEMAR